MRPEIAAFATPAKHRVKLAQLSAGPEPWKILSLTETKDKRRPAMRDPIGVPRLHWEMGANVPRTKSRRNAGVASAWPSMQPPDRNPTATTTPLRGGRQASRRSGT